MDSLVWVGLKVIATAYASLTIANTIPASDVGAHANEWVDAVGYVLVPDSSQVRHSHGIPRVHRNTAWAAAHDMPGRNGLDYASKLFASRRTLFVWVAILGWT
jgi:hypothetical protein